MPIFAKRIQVGFRAAPQLLKLEQHRQHAFELSVEMAVFPAALDLFPSQKRFRNGLFFKQRDEILAVADGHQPTSGSPAHSLGRNNRCRSFTGDCSGL
jgi:hypothetical protein